MRSIRKWLAARAAIGLMEFQIARALMPQRGVSSIAGLIVGIILAIIATIIGIQMLPSVITSWVAVSATSGIDANARTLTGVGQLVTVVIGIILAVSVILIVLRIADRGD